ncbi:MAG: hypothetical protein ONB44_08675 [candidate division KSB1 bacterium]|nr:hypothetical protein [candidate division KSB1 bacterium]MDZ7311313.1 hypothetical protein [candidate division KSB1 bacterium]
MTKSKTIWTDEQVEEILGNLLRIGVILSVVVVFVGGVFLSHSLRRGPPRLSRLSRRAD